jgi:hypothetical protein
MVRPTRSPKGKAMKFAVSVSPESWVKLESYCHKNDRQRSWVIDKLIARYLGRLR